MKTLVVYGGRFQPPHKGHLGSYKHLTEKFGSNVFMASAEKPPGPKDLRLGSWVSVSIAIIVDFSNSENLNIFLI